jgi:5S rRNA maturation endonuclease (ribonuclease M5)
MEKLMKSYLKYKEDKSQEWANFKEKLEYLKKSVDSRYLLESLGVKLDHESYKEIRCACPVHGGDNKTAFRFNKETHTWVCFTHKCHEIYGNDIIGLIKAVTGRDFVESVRHLTFLTGDANEVDYIESKRKREMSNFIKSYDNITLKPESVNEQSLNKFKTLRSNFFIRQGFKSTTLDYFEISGGWKDKQGIIRDIIPIRNDKNELVSYSLRDIRENADQDFKYIFTPGFDKDNCLYNLNRAQEYGDNLPIIVVEGFKSVWRLYEYGIKNVVATMGAGITEGQQLLLCRFALKGVVIMNDNDKAGVDGTIKALADLNGRLDISPVFIQEIDKNGKGLDPSDLTQQQVYEYLETYF